MKRSLSNEKGQVLIEGILLMTLLVGGMVFLINNLRENQVMAKIVSAPWVKISGMIESGNWAAPEEARKLHPNQLNRSVSNDPR